MNAALALLAYSAVLLAAGAPLLARAGWPDRAPRLAVTAWFAVTGSAVISVILAGLVLLVPHGQLTESLSRLLATCAIELRTGYAHPGGAPLAGAGLTLALAVTARVAWCTAVTLAKAARGRRDHRLRIRVAGRLDPVLGVVVVDDDEPAAWCLPGEAQAIVVTSAAIAALDQAQLAAVLHHERAHQRGRHHLLVSLAGSLASAFPRVPAFRNAHEQVARLTELLADDAAARASCRLTVAGALLAVGSGVPAGAAALAAGGSTAASRIRRLIAAPAPLSRITAAAGALTVIALAAFPLAALTGPAIVAASRAHCPHASRTATTHPLVSSGTRPSTVRSAADG
jgi:Zn-dependent protease with chaperone function